MPGLEQIDPRKIWKNYVIALTLIFALVSISHFAELFVGGDARTMAGDINVSGGQRMLSQRILYFATAYQHSEYQDTALRDGLQEAVEQFRDAHVVLTSHAYAPELQAMYFSHEPGMSLDQDARRFLKDAQAILGADHAERDRALLDMQSFAPNGLLHKLDRLVHIYEDLSHQNVDVIEQASMLGYLMALFALLFEAIFIFRPSHQTIVKAFSQLEDAKSELEEREKDAFSALEEAEEAWAEAEEARITIEKSQSQSHAMMANASYEMAAPLTALKLALDESMGSKDPKAALAATRSAVSFADVTDQMRRHIMDDQQDSAAPQKQIRAVCNLPSVLKVAIGTVSASQKDQAPIVLAPPKHKPPVLICDTLAVFRTVLHLLRDAQDLAGNSEIRLEFDVQSHAQNADISMTLVQRLDPDETKHRPDLGAADRKLSDIEIRATILDQLVSGLGGQATVLHKEDRRCVRLTFPAELQSQRQNPGQTRMRRAS